MTALSLASAQRAALIVYAHQDPASFNAAARDVAAQELTAQGFRVTVSDLYAVNFRANATRDDVSGENALINHSFSSCLQRWILL